MNTKLPLILEAEQLQAALGEVDSSKQLLIVDLCTKQHYDSGHIPGAQWVATGELIFGQAPAPGKLPSLERLQALFSRLGLEPETHVVAYDDQGGCWAGRLIWTLDIIGHTRYSFLNGGRHAWLATGFAMTQEVPETHSTKQHFSIHPGPMVDLDYLLDNLKRDDLVIWDARTAEEYRGEKVSAQRGGHIPGAINCDWLNLLDNNNHQKIRPDVAEYLARTGFNSQQEIVTHCQTHRRSGLTYLVGKMLGYNIKAYPGSWSEWGNHPHTPIELSSPKP